MGLWNTHGLMEDEEEVEYAVYDVLCLRPGELEALVEHCRREQWVWQQMAKHAKGQSKRKRNLIAKHYGLRMEKWIDLTAQVEMQLEEEHGMFAHKEDE